MDSTEDDITIGKRQESLSNVVDFGLHRKGRPCLIKPEDETDILNEVFRIVRMMPDGEAKSTLNRCCCKVSEIIIRNFFEKKPT